LKKSLIMIAMIFLSVTGLNALEKVTWKYYHSFPGTMFVDIYDTDSNLKWGTYKAPSGENINGGLLCEAGHKICMGSWNKEGHQFGCGQGCKTVTDTMLCYTCGESDEMIFSVEAPVAGGSMIPTFLFLIILAAGGFFVWKKKDKIKEKISNTPELQGMSEKIKETVNKNKRQK